MRIPQDFRELLQLLNSKKIEYLVIDKTKSQESQ
jgi:hypothetical protein